jgi:Putative abortive phage resistance protein AbiGi, antitoxin
MLLYAANGLCEGLKIKKRRRERKMVDVQRYVSSELSHFVGKGKSEEDQYRLLLQILRTGLLMHKPFKHPQQRALRLDFSQLREIEDDVVCFCDIPTPDLAIHVGKYSKFGLAFKKEFLVEQGACPVFYVANETPVPINPDALFPHYSVPLERITEARAKGTADRKLYFQTSVIGISKLFIVPNKLCAGGVDFKHDAPESDFRKEFADLLGLTDAQIAAVETALKANHKASSTIRNCTDFLWVWVFPFIKYFDAKLPPRRSLQLLHGAGMEGLPQC